MFSHEEVHPIAAKNSSLLSKFFYQSLMLYMIPNGHHFLSSHIGVLVSLDVVCVLFPLLSLYDVFRNHGWIHNVMIVEYHGFQQVYLLLVSHAYGFSMLFFSFCKMLLHPYVEHSRLNFYLEFFVQQFPKKLVLYVDLKYLCLPSINTSEKICHCTIPNKKELLFTFMKWCFNSYISSMHV